MAAGLPETGTPLIRSLPDAIVLVGADGRVVDATDRVDRILGRTADALVGTPFAGCFAEGSRAEVQRIAASLGADPVGPGEAELDATVARPDGEEVEVTLTVNQWSGGLAAVLHQRTQSADLLLAGMLDAVSAADASGEVVEAALREIGLSLDWDRGAMWVVDDRTGLLRAVAVWEREDAAGTDRGSAYRKSTFEARISPDEGLPGRAWSMGATIVPERFDEVDQRLAGDDVPTPTTGLFHPVRAGGRTVGVLELLSTVALDPEEWVSTALVAVEPALGHLLERLRDRLAVDAAEGRLAMVLDAGEFGVATFERRADWAEWSAPMAELHGLEPVAGQGSIGQLLAEVHPDDVNEVRDAIGRVRLGSSEPTSVDYRIVGDDDTVRWLATRITASAMPGGQVLVAAISSDVTENRQSAQRVRRRAMAVEGLQWVTQALISGRELHDTALAVAHAATGVLGATYGVVLYLAPAETGNDLAWAISGLPTDVVTPTTPTSVDLPKDLEDATRSVALDLRAHPEVRRFVLGLGLPVDVSDTRSALVVPVRGEGHERLGTMLFLHREAGYFTEDDVRLAHAIGTSTGVAVENAQRHEQQRLVAAAFQQEQLPPSDIDVPGAEVCVRYHPGRAGLEVGGDWYDVIPLEGNRVGLAVGDVCGHGLTAAAHMGQFRYSFRALVQSSIDPAAALATLNRLAIHELRTTVTVVYVELDLDTGACRVWRCGHLPPAVASSGLEVRWLGGEQRSPMLGFLPDIEVEPATDHLMVGEVLLLYTDGLVERRDETIDDGIRRLSEALLAPFPQLDRMCDDLYGGLVDAATAEDDTAILAVRRT